MRALRASAGAFATAVVLVGGLGVLPSAVAAERYLTVVPARGTLDTPIDLHVPTGAFCPPDATRMIVRMTGGNLTGPFNLTGNTDIVSLDSLSIPGTTIVPLIWTWRDAEGNVEPEPVQFDGRYRITLSCLKGLSLESLGDTVADVAIDRDAGMYRITTPQPAQPDSPSGADPSEPVTGDSSAAPEPGTGADPAPDTADGAAESASGDPGTSASGSGSDTGDSGSGASGGTGSGATGMDGSGATASGEGTGSGVGGESGAAQPMAATSTDSGRQSLLLIGGALLLAAAGYSFWKGRRRAGPDAPAE